MRKGMTLVELLIVIGIITVIAGISLSVLMQVRKRAYLTPCISNLRQLVLAVHAYENAWGMIPLQYDPIHKTSEGEFGFVVQLIYPYIKDRQIYICPADPTPGIDAIWDRPIIWRGVNWASSYRTSLSQYNLVEDVIKKRKISIPPIPADLVLFFCGMHVEDLRVNLIARYGGEIEVAPLGRYRFIGIITEP
jgi:prepilin-type N-terminal cleavage/methylation domain-containing protein